MHSVLLKLGLKVQDTLEEIDKKLKVNEGRSVVIEPTDIDYIHQPSGAIITLRNKPISSSFGVGPTTLDQAQFISAIVINHEEANQADALSKSTIFTGPLEPTSLEPSVYHREDLLISCYGVHLVRGINENLQLHGIRSLKSVDAKYEITKYLSEYNPVSLIDWSKEYDNVMRIGGIYQRLIDAKAEVITPIDIYMIRPKSMGAVYEFKSVLELDGIGFRFKATEHIYHDSVDEDTALASLGKLGANKIITYLYDEEGPSVPTGLLLEYGGAVYFNSSVVASSNNKPEELVRQVTMYGTSYVSEQQLIEAGFKRLI